MAWLYISIVLLMRVVQSVFGKSSAKLVPNNSIGYLKYNAFYMWLAAIPALLLFIISIIGQSGELFFGQTLLYASISGVALGITSICSLYAVTTGSMALNSLFGTAGLIVPSIAGIFLYEELLSPMQYVSIVIFMVGAYCLAGCSKDIFGKFTMKTLTVLILNLLMNGATMLTQTMFAKSVPEGNVSFFSLMSFVMGAVALTVVFVVMYFIVRAKQHKAIAQEDATDFVLIPKLGPQNKLPGKVYIYSVYCAIAVFFVSYLITLSASSVSPVILFSTTCGGATVISAIVGAAMFNEKLNKKGIIGLILGIGALIMIKVFAI